MCFESDDYQFIRFPFDRVDDDSLCLCNLWEKQQLAVKLTNDFSAKNDRSVVIQLILGLQLAFGLLRELHYSNETLEHWPRGTFAAFSAKE